MYNRFIPLAPGEVPGDPELGGWRPLPKGLFGVQTTLSVPSFSISLEEAVKLVGFKVKYNRLKRAVEALASRFAQSPGRLRKGGVVHT